MNEKQLERILSRENLLLAFKRVKKNGGAAGVDSVSIADYPKWAQSHWPKIRRALLGGYYVPAPVRRVEIPKKYGQGVRKLGIPTVNERVIQQAIAQILVPIIDPTFSESSFGFRPGRSAHHAVKQVQGFIKERYRYAVVLDLSKFFDRVSHDVLMKRLRRHIKDKRVLKLIGRYLRAGVMIGADLFPTPEGVPQGGPLSPLLANVVLDDLDEYLERNGRKFARYADDFVICVKHPTTGHRVKKRVTRFLSRMLKLVVNEDKSSVVKTNDLNFLGFSFRGKKICWSDRSLDDFKHRIRRLTKRSWGISMERRYRELKVYIRGWVAYFGLSEYYRPLLGLDEWIRRRIRMCYLKQWVKIRTRVRNLLKLGVPLRKVLLFARNSKGPYRLAKTYATQLGMTNEWLKKEGLVSVRDLWVLFHYP